MEEVADAEVFKLYLTGIETKKSILAETLDNGSNCTLLELKPSRENSFDSPQ